MGLSTSVNLTIIGFTFVLNLLKWVESPMTQVEVLESKYQLVSLSLFKSKANIIALKT